MKMKIIVDVPLVSVNWLHQYLDAENLLIFDATISKVTSEIEEVKEVTQIEGAQFFDIQKVFSEVEAPFSNTVLSTDKFEIEAQKLGVNQDSCIVVYDNLGVYASARVWWMFKLMGFKNIAVLNGGFPVWKKTGFSTEKIKENLKVKGDFKVDYQPNKICFIEDVLLVSSIKNKLIIDARSEVRFFGKVPEPRVGVRSGHIPNSINLPYTELQSNGKMKSEKVLRSIFKEKNPNKKELVFSCGTGITACVLALAAEVIGCKNYSVYDGSWTEWGSANKLPIEL